MPPAYVADADGRPLHSWRVLLLPFLDQQELYQQYNFDEPWNGPNNRKLMPLRPGVYALHDETSQQAQETNYLAVVGRQTAWPGSRAHKLGKQKTEGDQPILVVENVGSGVSWLEPRDLQFDSMNMSVAADSPSGISSRYQPPAVVTTDGTVLTLPLDMDPQTLRNRLLVTHQEPLERHPNVKIIDDGRDRPLRGSAKETER